jgi:hypothetical protein
MILKEEILGITGKQRRFLLYRVAEVEAETARTLCSIPQGTYNSWTANTGSRFNAAYQRLDELQQNYKEEAIKLLRRDNQLAAVMLEEKIINKMKEEVELGEYNLTRTNLARDVYTRLISDLDVAPATTQVSWEQRLQNIFIQNPATQNVIGGGTSEVIQATSNLLEQPQEGILVSSGEQAPTEATAEA